MKNWQFALVFVGVFALIIGILKVFPPPGSKEPGFRLVRMEITIPENFRCGDAVAFKDVPKAAKTLNFESAGNYLEEKIATDRAGYKPKCSPQATDYKFILTAMDDKSKIISKAEAKGSYAQ
jgi:hypothetical protein